MKSVSLPYAGLSPSAQTKAFIALSITVIGLSLLSGLFDSYLPLLAATGFCILIWLGSSTQIALVGYLLAFSYSLPLIDVGAEFYLDDFLFVLLLALLIGNVILNAQPINRGQLGKTLFIFGCAAALLTATNVWRFDGRQLAKSVFSIFRLGEYILAYFMVSTLVQDRKQARHLFVVLIIGAVWVVLAGIYQWVILQWPIVVSTLSPNHAHIGVYIIITFFIALTFFYRNKNFVARTFLAVLMVLMLIVLVESRSRAAWIGFALAFVIYALLRKSRILFTFIVLVAIIWGTTQYTPAAVRERVEYTFQSQSVQPAIDLSTLGRLYIWRGVAQLLASPVNIAFGVGLGAFQYAIKPFVPLFADGATGAHNNFLHMLAELGILGLILFIALLWRFFKFGWRMYRQSEMASETRDFSIAFLSILAGLVATMPTQETFSVQEANSSFLGYLLFVIALLEKLMAPAPENDTT